MLSFKRYAGRTTEKEKMLNDDTEQLRGSIQFKIWEALYSGNYKEIKHLSTQAGTYNTEIIYSIDAHIFLYT